MRRLFDLSLRHKIPLWGSALIVVATVAVSVGLMFRALDDLKRDLIASSEGLGNTLAKTLFPPLLQDDLWRAIEIVRAPLHDEGAKDPLEAEAIFVVSPELRITLTTRPHDMPLQTELAKLGADYRQLAQVLADSPPEYTRTYEFADSKHLYVVTPIAEEGQVLGTLVLRHSKDAFLPRFYAIAWRGTGIGLLVLAILLPLNWYWGRRMAQPLMQLAHGMNDMVHGAPAELSPDLYSYRDELGQLFDAYREAAAEIRQKAALEREVLQSERLAAVGRLAAGIAHEVNNPLAGMLMALDNLKQRGCAEPSAQSHLTRTLAFLERGLEHVSQTLAALLVEARVPLRPLTGNDFEDARTLIEPQCSKKSLRLTWRPDSPETVALPAGPVRQILINLLLNAVQATAPGGQVRFEARVANGELLLEVANDGEPPPAAILGHIFEPFVSGREGGHGLGLWVTYQIVQQLAGYITCDRADGMVIFRVRLPIKDAT
jgi:signal transduction histidine kinase